MCIANQLDMLHQHNYVHGDVRLSNMTFHEEAEGVTLIDFDLSRIESENPVYAFYTL